MAVVAAFLLHFYFSARALGLELPLRTLLRVFPWVLAAMALPVSFGGWGLREAAAAGLYEISGLPAEHGAAIGLAYGAIALLGSSPALLLPLLRLRDR